MIRVGVAGWDYPDWNGVVYPARPGSRFDRLLWIARFVDLIEINVSFYRPLPPQTAAAWLRRTERCERLRFSAKAHRSWSHEPRAALDEAIAPTLAGLEPLHAAGRLGALLVQFPQSFHFDAAARERLERIAGAAPGWPLVVEVRHASWAAPEADAFLATSGLGWCAVDQPRVGGSTLGLLTRGAGPVAYLRLHGRNAADWFREDAGRDARYDYLYAEPELRELAAAARRMAESAPQVFVVQNNHFRGQALVNALQMRGLLEDRARVSAPRELIAAYPQLAGSLAPEGDLLF